MTQRKQTKHRYSPEFKLEAIWQVIKYQQRILTLDLAPIQLRKWIRQYEAEPQGVTPAGVALTPDQRRIWELEKQVKCVLKDKEILKQAAV
ncbi:TPA: transposase [Klebsiella variicola]|nr:transposase [Klebsiella variicola]HCB0487598.1 transposase [Klebsiella pneumoniae]